MLTLKMMGGEDLADFCTSKSFTLVDLPQGSVIAFGRGPTNAPEIAVTYRDGEIEKWAPAGNTYVMQDGKTISTFSHAF